MLFSIQVTSKLTYRVEDTPRSYRIPRTVNVTEAREKIAQEMSTEMVRCPWASFHAKYFEYKPSDPDIECCINKLVEDGSITRRGDEFMWSWGTDNPEKLAENDFFEKLVGVCGNLGSLTLSGGRTAKFRLWHQPNHSAEATIDGGNHRMDGCIYPITATKKKYTMQDIAVAAEYKLKSAEANIFEVRLQAPSSQLLA